MGLNLLIKVKYSNESNFFYEKKQIINVYSNQNNKYIDYKTT